MVLKNSQSIEGDIYIEKIQQFLLETHKSIESFEKHYDTLLKLYQECCDYYYIDKNDEKAKKSDEFFRFFTQFFDQVGKCMPKEEKKKPANKNQKDDKRKYQVGQKVQGMGDLVSELKMKQQMQEGH